LTTYTYDNIQYLSADINERKAMVKEDIVNLSFEDNSFDIIFCSHVLEHVEDDKRAMRELKRVLKPGGFAILQVPIYEKFLGKKILETNKLASVRTPEERKKFYGHPEHVRIYGKDYKKRLEEAGFSVKVEKFAEDLGIDMVKKICSNAFR
jgi:ubiquinone/menaquinone biosynthesis C-methylase UbiE